MAKPPVIRTFQIPKSSKNDDKVTIRLTEPDLVAEGLYLQTWASSEVLARQLRNISIDFPPSSPGPVVPVVPVLELGAGTGLVGLAAACVWGQPVVLTELAPIVPGLAANIAVNAEVLLAEGAPVRCGTLDWARPTQLLLDGASSSSKTPEGREVDLGCAGAAGKAHVLIASDTIYSEDHPEMLARVIVEWLSREAGARAIVCYAMRVSYLDYIRDMWERLESAGLEAVAEGRDNADSDVFDDECLIEWCVWRWKET